MKVTKDKYVCPKCKEEYFNNFLASYSNHFENAAKSFSEENKIITKCEKCKVKLVQENLLQYFNNKGEYSPIVEKNDFSNEYDVFDLYLKTLDTIKNFYHCNAHGEIEIISTIEKNDTEIQGVMIVKGKTENNDFELLRATIDRYVFTIGDRKNYFMENRLINILNVTVSNIYEYLFIDDSSAYFNKKNESNIYMKRFNVDNKQSLFNKRM